MILVTGSRGLIGAALCDRIERHARHFDLKDGQDVVSVESVSRAMRGCEGVVHLAAVSRVAWAELDPITATATNVQGTEVVARAAAEVGAWLLFVSSREVYGHTEGPVVESAPLRPINHYGRTKVDGERIATEHGGCIARLSNVYGSVGDHHDRVVPAFARAAVEGRQLRVEGADNSFDFVHIDDAADGLLRYVEALQRGERPSPIHFTTGTATGLGLLARICVERANSASQIVEAGPRGYDVSSFCGDPSRARQTLGWVSRVSVEIGVRRFVDAFTEQRRAALSASKAKLAPQNGGCEKRGTGKS